jgi:hypothetical protein
VAQIPVISALAANKLWGGFGTFASSLWAALAAIAGGARLIRPVIVAICLIMLARYLWHRRLLVF